jgi:hypothetical protein
MEGIAYKLQSVLDKQIGKGNVYKGSDCSRQIKVSELIAQTSGLPDHETDKPKGIGDILGFTVNKIRFI